MNDVFKTHGAVSWTELLTTDPAAARAFYEALFGWRFEEMPMPDGGPYSVIRVGDGQIGGIMQRSPAAGDQPPMWGSYVTVDDLDAALTAAGSHGGQILDGPTDIPEVGRCALLQDPQGAQLHAIEYLSSVQDS